MAMLLKGKTVTGELRKDLQKETAKLRESGVTPCLAIVRIGEREDDIAYERGAVKCCEEVGIKVHRVLLSAEVSQESLMAEICALNRAEDVHGVLMFLPLPRHLNEEEVRKALLPSKDVDGITDGSLAAVFSGHQGGFAPCTAEACVEILERNGISAEGRRAVVIGRSLVIGKPVAMLLLNKNATVTICHSRTKNLAEICRAADLLVVAAGKAGVLGAESVHAGQTVLDVGIHVNKEGNLCGDVRFSEVEPIVEAITPVPGGVGTVTTSILAKHVVEAASRALSKGR